MERLASLCVFLQQAKEGMNGDMGSDNGCNRMYDEMMDELTDGDGGNRTGEHATHIYTHVIPRSPCSMVVCAQNIGSRSYALSLNRPSCCMPDHVLARAAAQARVHLQPHGARHARGRHHGAEEREAQDASPGDARGAQPRQPVWRRPCAHGCLFPMQVMTNRGAAFTKGKEEPTEVKSALIDRAIVSFVRTLTASTRSDDEFRAHLQTQEARRRLRMFRILTCVTGITKMAIYRQPHFMPDMAYAQRVWDFLDKQLVDAEYSLPTLTPRKNEKRLENCITYTVMNAVAHRFFFKQVCHRCGRRGLETIMSLASSTPDTCVPCVLADCAS